MSELGEALSKVVHPKRISVSQTGVRGRNLQLPEAVGDGVKPQTPGRNFVFFGKKAILMPLNHILHVFRAFERTRFLTFESQLKKLNCSILLLLTI